MSVRVQVDWNSKTDEIKISGDCNKEGAKEIIENWITSQIGAGEDKSKPNIREEYTVQIWCDLSDDSFSSKSNCGNKGLRDGILLMALKRSLSSKIV